MTTAFITGVTGQDGSYLAELLLERGSEVHGLVRRSSFNTDRIDHLCRDPYEKPVRLHLYYGDLTDGSQLARLVRTTGPDEIVNLSARLHVGVSFQQPEHTCDVGGLGVVRLLEAVRDSGGRHPPLSGRHVGDVRRISPAAVGTDPVRATLPLRCGQDVRALDHAQLPRGLRHVRRQQHPVQPRIPPPWPHLRHTERVTGR